MFLATSCKKEEETPVDCECFPKESLDRFYNKSNLYFESIDSLIPDSSNYSILKAYLNGEELDLGQGDTVIDLINYYGCPSPARVTKKIFDVHYGDVLELELNFLCGTCKPGFPKEFKNTFCDSDRVYVENFGVNNAKFNLVFILPSEINNRHSKYKKDVQSYCNSSVRKGLRILPIGYWYPHIQYNFLGEPEDKCF